MRVTRALSRAEVRVYSPSPESALVSINDTHGAHYDYMEDLALRPWRDILWMRFDDVGAGERGAMTEEQARQICDFVVLHGNRNIITHCSGGISRSGGVSAFLEVLGWDMQWLHRHQPNAHVKSLLLRAMGIWP